MSKNLDVAIATTFQEAEPVRRRPSLMAKILKGWNGRIGAALLVTMLVLVIFAPILGTVDPTAQNLTRDTVLQKPGLQFFLGTDALGRDLYSRILYGARISLLIEVGAIAIAVVAGIVLGASAATSGGTSDRVIMRLMDATLAFPLLILAISISVALGRGMLGPFIAIAIVHIPIFTRLARGQALRINQEQYVLASDVMGGGTMRRAIDHVIPNMINPIIVQASASISFAILLEAGLSFLGLGLQPPAPSLGLMIAEAKAYMSLSPHIMFVPAGAIFLIVLGFNLLGDALSEALDPRSESRR